MTPKDTLLERLLRGDKPGGTRRYARYTGLPLRYAGGKSLGVGHIIEHIPDDIESLVSPFFGGGAVEIACAKELGLQVTGYDVFELLTNYWKVQLDYPKALAGALRAWKPTKETYGSVKERLRKHWKEEELIEDPIVLAAHYWYNHNLSYGPGFLGWMSKIYEESKRFSKMIGKVEEFKCPNLSVAHGEFADVLRRHNGSFLYCDPPYYLDGDSKVFKGIYPQRNFPIHHNKFNHTVLRDLLLKRDGGFVLSYNDCKAIRDLYSGCKFYEVKWQYTLGQGETRIGKNRIERGTNSYVKSSHELLIVKLS